MATILIASSLKRYTNQLTSIEVQGQTLKDILLQLIASYPGLKPFFFTEQQELTPFVNYFINNQDARILGKEKAIIQQNDIIHILPAIAGG